jgi:uncharacterized membrane protein
LQGIADAAAAAAVSGDIVTDARARAERTITANGDDGIAIAALAAGRYDRDASRPIDTRFAPSATDVNAVRVDLVADVPLFFGSFITGTNTNRVRAHATAARMDMIAFDIGSALIASSGGLPNAILSQLAGTTLGLSDTAVSGLASSRIDVIEFADQLRLLQGAPGSTFGEAFDREADIGLVVRAMAAATDDPAARSTLLAVADKLGDAQVTVSDLIELGPFRGLDVNDGREHAAVDTYSLLRNLLELTHENGYDIALNASVAGLTTTKIRVAGGRGYERSPWLTLTSAYDFVLRTATTRIGIEAGVATPLGTLRVPLYTELAAAEARVDSVDCPLAQDNQQAELGVTPSLAEVALADIASGAFNDMSTELGLKPARILNTLLVKVDADADVSLGGNLEMLVPFSREEIDAHMRKTVGTEDIAAAAAASLMDDVDLNVTLGGLGLGTSVGAVTGTVGLALSAAAPGIDTLLNQLTQSLGLKLGAADVSVVALRCGRPSIVA